MFNYKITVFTPTYNRGYIIENAYHSLCRQSVKDFEWVVVDDGSTDDTAEKFEEWMKIENGFPIKYKKVANGGKMRATNLGATLANGELFIILDSDDYLTDNAIETIIKWEKTIHARKNDFTGVAGLKCHFDLKLVGTTFEGEYLDASAVERKKYRIAGDKAEVFYTELIQRHPFPEIEGEKFVSEGVTWMEICEEEHRVIRWFNEKIYCCEYREDGYSQELSELALKNPKGLCLNVKKQIQYCKPHYLEKLRLWHSYAHIAKRLSYSNQKIRADLEISYPDYCGVLIVRIVYRLVRGR